MRFPQLPIGARFEYQGKLYSKTSALLASAEDGSGQRIIPKYADLAPVDKGTPQAAPATRWVRLDSATLADAIAAHDATCRDLLRQVSDDPTCLDTALARLDGALTRLRGTLDEAASI